MGNIQIHSSWLQYLEPEFNKPYMLGLKQFLLTEKQSGATVYPPFSQIFNALNSTPLDKVKVLILGQDPYHGEGQANGLCFSVNPGIPFPPSLRNIFKEMSDDLQIPYPRQGDLTPWAAEGVLLLNATLTVRKDQAGAHQGKGWELFTDKVIEVLNQHGNHIVFILWGKYAGDKSPLIDTSKHLVLKAPHPSPLSASRGFFGSKPFSKTNQYLINNGLTPVNWKL
jgi:uracil-DNA glycosylase